MTDRTYTTEQAAAVLGIDDSLIRKWKHRRKVTPVGYALGRGRPAPLYRLAELEPLAKAYLERTTRRSSRADLASGPR